MKMTTEKQTVKINVANGYEPATINLKAGVPAKLVFNRSNESMCLAEVKSADLKFDKQLPMNTDVTVKITPQTAGEYNFTCGMGMFHGKVVVK